MASFLHDGEGKSDGQKSQALGQCANRDAARKDDVVGTLDDAAPGQLGTVDEQRA